MITIRLLLNNGYEIVTDRKYIANLISDFDMPYEYLDYVMFIKYDWQGRVDIVFGCPDTEAILSKSDKIKLELLITHETLRIYENTETIDNAECEILAELENGENNGN